MPDFLAETFLQNTYAQWLAALAVVVAAPLIGKLLAWFFAIGLRKATEKTATKLDDILIEVMGGAAVPAAALVGVWLALKLLTIPQNLAAVAENALQWGVIFGITWSAARLIDPLIKEYVLPLAQRSESDLIKQLLPSLRRGAKTLTWTIGGVVGLNTAGFEIAGVMGGLGIAGLAGVMAAKDTVSNLLVLSDRPFKVGDRIRVSGYDGTILEIGLRSTRLRTLAGTLVTIPSSAFTDHPVENVSAAPSHKVTLNLGFIYGARPEQMQEAMDTLRAIAQGNENLEENAAVGCNAFRASSMNIVLVYYIKKGCDVLAAQTAVNMEILTQFHARGLELSLPTQTIHHQQLPAAA